MQWKGGGPLAIGHQLEVSEAGVRQRAHEMMQEIAADANRNQREIIERAETETGRRRAAEGKGSAGRIETGQMVNGTNGSATWADDDTVSAKWGWQDPEDYYSYQDDGTQRIAPMLSLQTSFLVARTEFVRRLRALTQNGTA